MTYCESSGKNDYGPLLVLIRRLLTGGALAVMAVAAPATAADDALSARADAETGTKAKADAGVSGSGFRLPRVDADPTEEQVLSYNEPMYFIVGGRGDTKARFQVSLQYRVFDREGYFAERLPWLQQLHLGYTQTSLWNLSEESRPFEDTTYRPSLYWQAVKERHGLLPDGLRYGFEHESNGQAGETSRSMNTLFVHPGWFFSLGSRQLMLAPKVRLFLNKAKENADIIDYRGRTDWLVRYGRDDSWEVSALIRLGKKDRSGVQLDLSYPLGRRIFARTGGFLYMQLTHGYGESLLEYDQKKDLQARIGVAIVR